VAAGRGVAEHEKDGLMTEKNPCRFCSGLGFRSLDNSTLHPLFNVYGLHRREHRNGKVTWEGDCIMCHGTGFEAVRVEPQRRRGFIAAAVGKIRGLAQ
jgi:DnaJ-class molecular chaperone